jgi:hypothetical protein
MANLSDLFAPQGSSDRPVEPAGGDVEIAQSGGQENPRLSFVATSIRALLRW